MSAGDYVHYREEKGSDLTTQVALAATTTGSTGVLSARNATSAINLQRIRIVPTTFAVGSLTFRETDATGAILAVVTQPSTVTGTEKSAEQSLFVDFGPKGWKMTAGAPLFLVRSSATGPGANVVIEAYGTTSGPVAIATTN